MIANFALARMHAMEVHCTNERYLLQFVISVLSILLNVRCVCTDEQSGASLMAASKNPLNVTELYLVSVSQSTYHELHFDIFILMQRED